MLLLNIQAAFGFVQDKMEQNMGLVNIDTEDGFSIKDFEEGNSIQVRVTIPPNEKQDYDKGKTVTVQHEGQKMKGRIVSEPILIDRKREDGKVTLSLILEKASSA